MHVAPPGLAADEEAEARAATNEDAAAAASSAGVAEALAGTAGPADEERLSEEQDSPVPLSAQELRARRLAALETGEPRSG